MAAARPTWRPESWDDRRELSLRRHIQDAERFRWLYPEVVTPSSPPKRIGHGAVYDQGCLYVYGGSHNGSRAGDIFCVDLRRRCWTRFATTGHQPRQVDGHSAFYGDGKMFVFGGTNVTDDGLIEKSNTVAYLDVQSGVWIKPEVQGNVPAPRDCHSASFVKHESKMVLFGGKGSFPEQRLLGDVHVLDMLTWTWSSPAVTGELPTSRENHGDAILRNRLFIVGGHIGNSNFVSGVSVLDLTSFVWSKFEVVGRQPPPRAGHSCFASDDKIYIFGGIGIGGAQYNDLWVLYTRFAVWTQLDVTGPVPTGRFWHSTSFLPGHSAVIFYGGASDTAANAQPAGVSASELLVLDFVESNETIRAASILASQEPGNLFSCHCIGCRPRPLPRPRAKDGASTSQAQLLSIDYQTPPSPGGAQGPHEPAVLCLEAPLCTGDQLLNLAYPADNSSTSRASRLAAIKEALQMGPSGQGNSGCGNVSTQGAFKRQRTTEDRSSIPQIFSIQDNNLQRRTTDDIMEAARRVLVDNFPFKNLEHTRQRSLLQLDKKLNVNRQAQQYITNLREVNQSLVGVHVLDTSHSNARMGPIYNRTSAVQRSAFRTPDQYSLTTPAPSLQDQLAHNHQQNIAFQEQNAPTRLPMAGDVVQAHVVGVLENAYVVNAVIDGKIFAGVIGLPNGNFAPQGPDEVFINQPRSNSPASVPADSSMRTFFRPDVTPPSEFFANVAALPEIDTSRSLYDLPHSSIDITHEAFRRQPLSPLLLTSSSPPPEVPVAGLGTPSPNATPPYCGPASYGVIQHRPTRRVRGADVFNRPPYYLQSPTGPYTAGFGALQGSETNFRTFLPPKEWEAETSFQQFAEAATPSGHSPVAGDWGYVQPEEEPSLSLTLGLPEESRQR